MAPIWINILVCHDYELHCILYFDHEPAKQHARAVAGYLGVSKGLMYLPGQHTVYMEDSDQTYPFRQRRYFYYLSGVDEPDCYLTYDIERDHLSLYIPPISPQRVIWFGRGSTVHEAEDKSVALSIKESTTGFDSREQIRCRHSLSHNLSEQ